jgi:uncharacterized repeat protein (TIGR01451 family)
MDSGGPDRPEGAAPRKNRFTSRPFVVRATVIFVAINALAVIALSTKGSAGPDSCGGGFSGYSGGGCVSDLTLVNVDAPDPVKVTGRLFYLVEVTNNGPDTAFNLEISDLLSPGLQVDWVLMPQDPYGYCSIQGREVFCNFYDVLDHQKVAITIVVRPPLAGTIKNVASVTSSNEDPHPANNTATQRTRVNG